MCAHVQRLMRFKVKCLDLHFPVVSSRHTEAFSPAGLRVCAASGWSGDRCVCFVFFCFFPRSDMIGQNKKPQFQPHACSATELKRTHAAGCLTDVKLKATSLSSNPIAASQQHGDSLLVFVVLLNCLSSAHAALLFYLLFLDYFASFLCCHLPREVVFHHA